MPLYNTQNFKMYYLNIFAHFFKEKEMENIDFRLKIS